MSRFKLTSEKREREKYWYTRNEYQGLQKEIRHLKDLLNKERDNAQYERGWRVQACNDLLETQQQLEKEKSLNEQLINRKGRSRSPLYKQRMMHRDSTTTSSMEVVTEPKAEKERYKIPRLGRKRQTSSQALIPAGKQQHLTSDLRNKLRASREEERKQQKVSNFRIGQDARCQDSNFAARQGADRLSLLETQQQLEKEQSLNEQLINRKGRSRSPLYKQRMMHRDSRTTSSMEVVDRLSFTTDIEEDSAPRREAAKRKRSAVYTETKRRQQVPSKYNEVEESFRDRRHT
ncbi:unnamed protein product [Pleuronectes platessa]|uniref:Uncharacterized protein n=1 Tax=Pleuronectes platessa TaxID=8262 RepID=A0A9N7TLJ8_PLEPL|nr:unnamed protein product [Pleuronectes platessa]